MHRQTPRILLLYALGALAVFMPIVAASWLAQRKNLLREQDRAGAIAAELLQRSDRIGQQLLRAFAELKDSSSSEPWFTQSYPFPSPIAGDPFNDAPMHQSR